MWPHIVSLGNINFVFGAVPTTGNNDGGGFFFFLLVTGLHALLGDYPKDVLKRFRVSEFIVFIAGACSLVSLPGKNNRFPTRKSERKNERRRKKKKRYGVFYSLAAAL